MVSGVESISGEKYSIRNQVDLGGSITATAAKFQTHLTVAGSFRRGTKWLGPRALDRNYYNGEEVFDKPGDNWILRSNKKNPDGTIQLGFDIEDPEKYDDQGDLKVEEYKKQIMGLNLSEEKLIKLIKQMIFNVFTLEHMKKLLASDDIEFVIGDAWFYLRKDNIAYRV
jgi:hypothetical protein